ncbi:hypothetical protein [Rhizobium sp.]
MEARRLLSAAGLIELIALSWKGAKLSMTVSIGEIAISPNYIRQKK